MSFNPKEHLITLKSKPYLEVKWRLAWMNQECDSYSIDTTIVQHEVDKFAIVKATVTCRTRGEPELRMATAYKREDKAHFPDYLEKADSGSIGRALGMLGYGTQWAEEFSEADSEGVVRTVDTAPKAVPDAPQAKPSPVQAPAPKSVAPPQNPPASTVRQTAAERFKETMKEPVDKQPEDGMVGDGIGDPEDMGEPEETDASLEQHEALEQRIAKGFEAIAALGKPAIQALNRSIFKAMDGKGYKLQDLRAKPAEWHDGFDYADKESLLAGIGELYKSLRPTK